MAGVEQWSTSSKASSGRLSEDDWSSVCAPISILFLLPYITRFSVHRGLQFAGRVWQDEGAPRQSPCSPLDMLAFPLWEVQSRLRRETHSPPPGRAAIANGRGCGGADNADAAMATTMAATATAQTTSCNVRLVDAGRPEGPSLAIAK